MLFRDTGLPEKDLIKKAFVRLQEGIRNDLDHNRNINTKNIDQQLDAMKQQFERKNPNASDAERDKMKQQLKQIRKNSLDQLEQQLSAVEQKTLNIMVRKAKFVSKMEPERQEVLAAAILVEKATLTPVDFMDMQKDMGEDVARVVAEFQHLKKYDERFKILIQDMKEETKLIMMGELINEIGKQLQVFNTLQPDQQAQMSRDTIRQSFNKASALFNVSPTADYKYMEAFNALYDKKIDAGMRVERDEDGLYLSEEERDSEIVHFPPLNPVNDMGKPGDLNLPPVPPVGPDGKFKGGRKPKL